MRPVDVQTEVEIARPVDEVAAYASAPGNVPSWYQNIDSVELLTQPPVGVGTRLAFVAHFLGRRLEYTYQIKEYEPGSRLVMATDSGPFPMETTYTWSPLSTRRTRMVLRNRGMPAGFFSLAAPALAAAMKRANQKDLARLKRLLEEAR